MVDYNAYTRSCSLCSSACSWFGFGAGALDGTGWLANPCAFLQREGGPFNLRPCLAGLQKELQLRLHAEPCQTGCCTVAPGMELRISRSLEQNGGDGAMKSWLHAAPRSSFCPWTALPSPAPWRRKRCWTPGDGGAGGGGREAAAWWRGRR